MSEKYKKEVKDISAMAHMECERIINKVNKVIPVKNFNASMKHLLSSVDYIRFKVNFFNNGNVPISKEEVTAALYRDVKNTVYVLCAINTEEVKYGEENPLNAERARKLLMVEKLVEEDIVELSYAIHP